MQIEENIHTVKLHIAEACMRSTPKRSADDVTLIAVTKTKPAALLKEAYEAGVRDFGENKVQEILEKYDCLPKDIRWHLIGHLQTNKVKYIVDKVAMIHSLDSVHLAQTIEKECAKADRVMPVLVQVNVAEEESKFGISCRETEAFVREVSQLPHLQVRGLMTVAPYVTDPEDNRETFSKLRQLLLDIAAKNIDNVFMNVLSMGMSGDYETAVEEGATLVRVGTNIFGARDYR